MYQEPLLVHEKDHSEFGASGFKRMEGCPGSIALSRGIKGTSSEYAGEGTAAHALAEECLNTKTNAKSHLYRRITLVGRDGAEQKSYTVTEDMIEAVQVYLDYVRGLPGGMEIEHEMVVKGYPELRGTVDHVGLQAAHLWVSDYKHGKGVPVAAKDNGQLLFYAFGEILRLNMPSDGLVTLAIIQPRASEKDPIDIWDVPVKDVLDWGVKHLIPAYEAAKAPNAPLRSGDHCRWCKAIPICPEQAKKSMELTCSTFEKEISPAPLAALTVENQVHIWKARDRIKKWLDEIEANLRTLVETGTPVPGCKLVRGRRPNAAWRDELSAEEMLLGALGKEAAYKVSLLTPTQAEKTMKEFKIPTDGLEDLIERGEGVPTLAEAEDKRPELPMKAEREFGMDFYV